MTRFFDAPGFWQLEEVFTESPIHDAWLEQGLVSMMEQLVSEGKVESPCSPVKNASH